MQTCVQARPSGQLARSKGFTLIELMVTLAVFAILVSIGVPSLVDTWRAWQRDVATRSFVTHVQQARSEAIKTSRRVAMCASADGATCAGNNNWMQGWIVFVDEDANQTPDNNRPILVTQGPLTGLVRMSASNNVDDLFFLPTGIMPANATTITVEPQGSASVDMNSITVSSSGRTRVSKTPKGT